MTELLLASLITLFSLPFPSLAGNNQCEFIRCRRGGCGCELLKTGWKEIARCDGHQWSYIIEKDSQRKLCKGIAALGGYEEEPCSVFEGDFKEFKKCFEPKKK